MATRWSSEFIVAEHRDLQASAMAVDWTGIYVLLAGRRYLGVKNLDDPSDTLRKFPRQSKYEVGTAEWNPSSTHSQLCAISSNQKVEILSWVSGELIVLHALGWHTRVISDLNWNRFDPNLLASCSIDTYTHIWDLRDARRPCISLSAVAGAMQVRWNRMSRYLLATAHNGDIKLWDQRKGTAPVQYITAHLANIHGLDWSPNHENQLATSSQDCTVKFFDITNPRRPENMLTAPSPVWRARYTPFGEGLLMVVVPPMRRGENSLLLWNLSNHSAPVHTFVGHTDVVLEFEWRRRKDDSSDYQLITWSKDQTLRIWKIEPFLQKLCGHPSEEDSNTVLSNGSTLGLQNVENGVLVDNASSSADFSENGLSEQDLPISLPSQPKTLQQEFSLINVNIRNITVDKMDDIKRTCTVTANVDGHKVILHISFPSSYPFNASPTFQFAQGTSVDNVMKAKILKVLKQTAQQRVRKNRSCLEPCLRQLVTTLEQLSRSEEGEASFLRQVSSTSLLDRSTVYSSFQDTFIPFPRTSGAKFCNVGMLVCFCRPPAARRLSTRPNPDMTTPRALAALAAGSYPDPPYSVSSYYFQDNRLSNLQSRSRTSGGRTFGKYNSSKSSKSVVVIYDASQLFYIHKELAEKYVFDSRDVPGMCLRNANVAATVGRRDLVQAWTLAALAASPTSNSSPADQDDDFPWPQHPFAKDMIQSLISHYAQHSDIQMAAMLCCAFGTRTESHENHKIKNNISKSVHATPGGSPYHTIHEVDMSLDGWNFSVLKQNRSNSWSESLDDFRLSSNIVEHVPLESETGHYIKMDGSTSWLYDEYKRAYAEILHRWHLLDARAQIMKYISSNQETHKGLEFRIECLSCESTVQQDAYCSTCKKPCLRCVVCHIPVKGSANFCIACGHGGHSTHMEAWFKKENVCPTGCGCHCLAETAAVLEP
ncbi:WD repeat domain 59 [Lycorma delicatula]|uniref:WD repeat domain 59 n=1 Tax=Lycorma delicatula TaxID=130591 RepID=UPI003F50E411